MASITDTLAWLVDIPSETGNEGPLRDAIQDRLSALPARAVGDSLVVGRPTADGVLLVGHLDTVPLQGHVGARIESDRLHGLGATDMKGGLAVMIHLLEDIRRDDLAAIFYAGEEGPITENELSIVLDDQPALLGAAAAVVMEPTDRALEAGCQGVVNARVSFEGVAAHSARPWLGVNAVSRAGDFLAKLDDLPAVPRTVAGLEFKEVISVTRAHGGVANNVIPSLFELNVNYRFAPDRPIEEATAHLERVCSDADLFEVSDWSPAAFPHADHPLFLALAEAADAPIQPKQGWTDVAQLVAKGIPAVNFGPGEASLAHKPGESVRLSDLQWAYDALSEVLTG